MTHRRWGGGGGGNWGTQEGEPFRSGGNITKKRVRYRTGERGVDERFGYRPWEEPSDSIIERALARSSWGALCSRQCIVACVHA